MYALIVNYAYVADIHILEQQNQKLTRDFASAQMNLESMKQNVRQVHQEYDVAKQVSLNLQSASDESSRSASYYMSENKSLKTQLQELQYKISALDSQVNHERLRNKNLESVVASQRLKEQHTLAAATALSRDIAQANDARRLAQADNQTLHQHLEYFQSSIRRELANLQVAFEQLKSSMQIFYSLSLRKNLFHMIYLIHNFKADCNHCSKFRIALMNY